MPQDLQIGVYFSANDVVYDWTIAFLNSFRTFNPNLRLILIPFDEQCDRLLSLQDTYKFEVYSDSSFARLESIGQAFELGHTPTGSFWFRRYAAFWGPCDRFMYLDARQVVLADLTPIILALDKYDFELLHFDCAIHQVYESGELRQELLRQGRARGFLSGLWASRKSLFTLEEFEKFAEQALKVRSQLNPRNTDQAFINYCCDMKPVLYGHVAEVLGDICQSSWARRSGTVYKNDNKYYCWDYGGLDHNKRVVLIHWAGFRLRNSIPCRSLFRKFYSLNRSLELQVVYELSKFPTQIVNNFIMLIKSNRIINSRYHRERDRFKDNSDLVKEKLPTFLCIGGQRCGSTWLDKLFRRHPEIIMSPKEYSFFNLRIRTEGFAQYYSCFESENEVGHIRGDTTPTYSAMSSREIRNIKKILPDLKIIFVIRNPVDRIVSSIMRDWTYSYLDKKKPTSRNIFALLRRVDNGLSIRLTDYENSYHAWANCFGKDRVIVKSYDELVNCPDTFSREILEFVGVEDPRFLPDDLLTKEENSSNQNLKEEIPPALIWYLAGKWLPKTRKLQDSLPDLDLSNWIDYFEEIRSSGKLSWYLISAIHNLYFVMPYSIAYAFYRQIRIRFLDFKVRKIIYSHRMT